MEARIQSQMRKGILEFLVLSILKKGDAYGAEIIEILKKTDMIIVEGTIYPLLSRLKKDAMIDYYWQESDSGHPRKYFQLTKSGEGTYYSMLKNWREIQKTVSMILPA